MRFLHTSDWHVGKAVRGRSRAAEHEAVVAEIVSIADERDVDLVLVAGDLYETAAPSPEADAIVYQGLLRLADEGRRPVVVVSGNHDNTRRLAAVAPLLALGGVTVQTVLAPPGKGGVAELVAGGTPVRIALVPFPSKRYIVRADDLMGLGRDTPSQNYDDQLRKIVGALATRFEDDTVNLVLAHLFCTGGLLGGGERSAHTIFDYSVSTTAFPMTAHYVALGHLHRPQSLPGPCPVWYSGSPLQMDFGESDDDKAVLLVNAEPGVPVAVEQVRLHAGRRFVTVSGTLAELATKVGSVGDAHVKVMVDEPARVGLADEVRELFPDAVEVTVRKPLDDPSTRKRPLRAGQTPHELFELYLGERNIDDARLVTLFDELLDEATRAGNDDTELVWSDDVSDAGGGGDAP